MCISVSLGSLSLFSDLQFNTLPGDQPYRKHDVLDIIIALRRLHGVLYHAQETCSYRINLSF